MKRKIFKNKKLGAFALIILIFSLVTVISSESLDINSSVNGTVTQIVKSIEKVTDIEVWANTLIKVGIKENIVRALLLIDNETPLPEQEVEFYLNNSLIDKKITDSEGYAKLIFNPNVSPGTYFFKAEFQGNPSLYLNPSFTEGQIEITELNGSRKIMFIEQNLTKSNLTIETNLTISNQTLLTINTDKEKYTQNETINLFGGLIVNGERRDSIANLEIIFNQTKIFTSDINIINGSYLYSLPANFEKEGEYSVRVFAENLSAETNFYFLKNYSINLDGMICKEFTDNVLFSSGYTNKNKDSTNFETWKIQTNCTQAGGDNCSLYNINTKSRILYASPYDEEITGEGYVQISELENSDCDNPEKEKYSEYIAYDTLKQEGGKWERYCGETKTQNSKCSLEDLRDYYVGSTCYGIKTYASQYSIVDVVEIKYTWCWRI